jgi:hypothetical protein
VIILWEETDGTVQDPVPYLHLSLSHIIIIKEDRVDKLKARSDANRKRIEDAANAEKNRLKQDRRDSVRILLRRILDNEDNLQFPVMKSLQRTAGKTNLA